eukprot:TRINITY_DN60636_c0_g1_i1.p1 TRINITY_DN60636_c0_g1~~TRINITY_DN60636_c0_g1_i1.p1  ORF type:complete len:176 (+),score=18.43 TRINITY_DN60636_c0_g1_i1:113-640(+)
MCIRDSLNSYHNRALPGMRPSVRGLVDGYQIVRQHAEPRDHRMPDGLVGSTRKTHPSHVLASNRTSRYTNRSTYRQQEGNSPYNQEDTHRSGKRHYFPKVSLHHPRLPQRHRSNAARAVDAMYGRDAPELQRYGDNGMQYNQPPVSIRGERHRMNPPTPRSFSCLLYTSPSPRDS